MLRAGGLILLCCTRRCLPHCSSLPPSTGPLASAIPSPGSCPPGSQAANLPSVRSTRNGASSLCLLRCGTSCLPPGLTSFVLSCDNASTFRSPFHEGISCMDAAANRIGVCPLLGPFAVVHRVRARPLVATLQACGRPSAAVPPGSHLPSCSSASGPPSPNCGGISTSRAPCLAILPGHQRLGLCGDGFFHLASELDAGSALG